MQSTSSKESISHVSTFFLEVKRHGSVPFWRHANLSDEDLNEQCANMAAAEEDYEDKLPDDEEEEEFDDGVETRTFITSMQ